MIQRANKYKTPTKAQFTVTLRGNSKLSTPRRRLLLIYKLKLASQLVNPLQMASAFFHAPITFCTCATIYYTVNGTTPSAANGAEYTTAISVAESCALHAAKEGSINSNIRIIKREGRATL